PEFRRVLCRSRNAPAGSAAPNAAIQQIARELGVGYLLEGSVRRGGDRVRVTAQLIQSAEQTHLWAETYERPLADVLSIQREIAEKITHSLSIQLLPVETGSAATSRSEEHTSELQSRFDL